MIDHEVLEATKRFAELTKGDDNLEKLRAFFDEMKRLGIARSRAYDLPHVDTIGSADYRKG